MNVFSPGSGVDREMQKIKNPILALAFPRMMNIYSTGWCVCVLKNDIRKSVVNIVYNEMQFVFHVNIQKKSLKIFFLQAQASINLGTGEIPGNVY